MSGTTAGSQIVLLRHGVLLENYTSSDLLIVLDRTTEIPAKIAWSYICRWVYCRYHWVLWGSQGWSVGSRTGLELPLRGKTVERPQIATYIQMKDLGYIVIFVMSVWECKAPSACKAQMKYRAEKTSFKLNSRSKINVQYLQLFRMLINKYFLALCDLKS